MTLREYLYGLQRPNSAKDVRNIHRHHVLGEGYRNTGGGKQPGIMQPGVNRGLDKEFQLAYEEYNNKHGQPQFTEVVRTPNSEEHMEQIEYEPPNERNGKRGVMRITYQKQGPNSSKIVVFSPVPPIVFAMLKDQAERAGRCGKLLWDIVRIRGTPVGTRYNYWHE